MVYRVTLSGSELNLSPGTARARLVGVSPANSWGPEPVENPIHLPACLASRARECSGSGAIGNIPVPAKSSAWGVVYGVTLSGSGLNLSLSTAVPDKPLGPWASSAHLQIVAISSGFRLMSFFRGKPPVMGQTGILLELSNSRMSSAQLKVSSNVKREKGATPSEWWQRWQCFCNIGVPSRTPFARIEIIGKIPKPVFQGIFRRK